MTTGQESRIKGRRDAEFGAFRLTRDAVLLCPDNTRVQLTPRLASILLELVRNDGAAISRLDLMEQCWPDNTIGEENLSRAIADLRKIFRAHGGDCIETVYGLGYRLNSAQSEYRVPEMISFCEEAWHRVYQRRAVTLDSAEDIFTRLVTQEAEFVPAWLGLAETQIHRMQLGYSTTLVSAPVALKALNRALSFDPDCASALALKGLLLTWAEWDFEEAGELLKVSCGLAENEHAPNQATGWHKLALGDLDSAEYHFERASAAKPAAMTSRAGQAFCRMYLGDHGTALHLAREMIRVDAHGAIGLSLAAIFEAALGTPDTAVSMAEESFAQLPESPNVGAILAYALARKHHADEARTILDSQTPVGVLIGSSTMAAPAWLELGETGRALEALKSGFATRCTWLLPMLIDPRMEDLDLEPLRAAVFR